MHSAWLSAEAERFLNTNQSAAVEKGVQSQ